MYVRIAWSARTIEFIKYVIVSRYTRRVVCVHYKTYVFDVPKKERKRTPTNGMYFAYAC